MNINQPHFSWSKDSDVMLTVPSNLTSLIQTFKEAKGFVLRYLEADETYTLTLTQYDFPDRVMSIPIRDGVKPKDFDHSCQLIVQVSMKPVMTLRGHYVVQ